MSPLLLICDPKYDYSRSFHEMLGDCQIETRHVLTGEDCLQAVRLFAPDFVLVSLETDQDELERVFRGIEAMTDRTPQMFLTGGDAAWPAAWGNAAMTRLPHPLDEASFVTQLMELSQEQTVELPEREDGVGPGSQRPVHGIRPPDSRPRPETSRRATSSSRQSAGLTAWDNEGGSIPHETPT